jgi:predicted solute-binding protein
VVRRPIRLGVVPYLNVAPMIHGLDHDARFELVRDVPARIAGLLRAGAIDLGTIPVIEFPGAGYRVVPGVAIGSDGPIRSVRLLHAGRLEDLRRVGLDPASRTSNALVRILLNARFPRSPPTFVATRQQPAELAQGEGQVVIGDAALYSTSRHEALDLGDEWKRLTALPFVYAFWAGREGAVESEEVALLQRALANGRSAIPEIARRYRPVFRVQLDARDLAALNEAYLRSNVVYDLGQAQQRGLDEFYRLAQSSVGLERVAALRFYGDP